MNLLNKFESFIGYVEYKSEPVSKLLKVINKKKSHKNGAEAIRYIAKYETDVLNTRVINNIMDHFRDIYPEISFVKHNSLNTGLAYYNSADNTINYSCTRESVDRIIKSANKKDINPVLYFLSIISHELGHYHDPNVVKTNADRIKIIGSITKDSTDRKVIHYINCFHNTIMIQEIEAYKIGMNHVYGYTDTFIKTNECNLSSYRNMFCTYLEEGFELREHLKGNLS